MMVGRSLSLSTASGAVEPIALFRRRSHDGMARKTRHRISYVLPLSSGSAGHRLGVNGLALDAERSVLYSAGRDGIVSAWDTSTIASAGSRTKATNPRRAYTRYLKHVQAHTNWINDLLLVNGNSSLVTASSDTSVKLWRPYAQDVAPPQTIGLHNDYVKCLASPSSNATWVASGGLDTKVYLWDLAGSGKLAEIPTADEGNAQKCSVYALGANDSLIATGGPEKIVKVWDSRSGKRVAKFVGHTDMIRDTMISAHGEIIMTASSDQTIRVWSMTALRCLYTLNMHNDSVWCLHSTHPNLAIFYSGDRSGFVAKTDMRNLAEFDDGLSLALCHEHDSGITRIAAGDDSTFWTSTFSSSINRWADIEMGKGQPLSDRSDSFASYRWPTRDERDRSRSLTSQYSAQSARIPPSSNAAAEKIPLSCVLRMFGNAPFAGGHGRSSAAARRGGLPANIRKGSIVITPEIEGFQCLRTKPEETIEGQNGLIKHVKLNDRRRVLTLDTAGEVMLWDLLQCRVIQRFGKLDIDDVAKHLTTQDVTADWCTIDTRIGTLYCELEENHCFNGELYADEMEDVDSESFEEDQRINLGKCILRNLFAIFVNEEINRDITYRLEIMDSLKSSDVKTSKGGRPSFSIELPQNNTGFFNTQSQYQARTPGFSINIATPAPPLPGSPEATRGLHTAGTDTSTSTNPQRESQQNLGLGLLNATDDYFSSHWQRDATTSSVGTAPSTAAEPLTPHENPEDKQSQGSNEPDKEAPNKTPSSFRNRFKKSFTPKKLGRTTQDTEPPKTANTDAEKVIEVPEQKPPEEEPPLQVEDTVAGLITLLQHEYSKVLKELPLSTQVPTQLCPPPKHEAPLLGLPSNVTVIIQEDRPDAAGATDLFESNIGDLERHTTLIERVGPFWLGECLLRNRTPLKDVVKVSFFVEPWQNKLPHVTKDDGGEKLTANRLLRIKRVLGYVAERLDYPPKQQDAPAPRARDWLEILCQDRPVPLNMTLAAVSKYVWRAGGDLVLTYRAISDGPKAPENNNVGQAL